MRKFILLVINLEIIWISRSCFWLFLSVNIIILHISWKSRKTIKSRGGKIGFMSKTGIAILQRNSVSVKVQSKSSFTIFKQMGQSIQEWTK